VANCTSAGFAFGGSGRGRDRCIGSGPEETPMADEVITRMHIGDPTRSPRRKLGPLLLVIVLLLVLPGLIVGLLILAAEVTGPGPTDPAPVTGSPH
jgi:hypothetical protein